MKDAKTPDQEVAEVLEKLEKLIDEPASKRMVEERKILVEYTTIKKGDIPKLYKEIRQKRAKEEGSQEKAQFTSTALTDLVGESIQLPPKYELRKSGVLHRDFDHNNIPRETLVCHNPIAVTGKTQDIGTGTVGSQIRFVYDGKHIEKNVPQAMLASVTKILDLAELGVGVNSTNAANLVRFLDELRYKNINVLKDVLTTED